MTRLVTIDRILQALILAALATAVAIYLRDPGYFSQTFAMEDGAAEYGTALFLFVASLVLLGHAVSLSRRGRAVAVVLMGLYALMFFAAAGEEISWGQRIFGWDSGEFFRANNKQLETNFHNLVIGEVHLAKTVFGHILTTALLLYLVVLPLVYTRVGLIRRLADRLVVPVPGLRHAFWAVAASLVIAAIDVNRKWEVYELVFSLLAVSIFLLPQNRDKVTGALR